MRDTNRASGATVVVAVNVGSPRQLRHAGGEVPTGIFKTAVEGPVWLGEAGLAGDSQVDRRNHGGPDKAVCVYAAEHGVYWSEKLGREVGPGGFGENLTTSGLNEASVRIGDVFRVGGALVQVSQPRSPCFKLAARHGESRLALWVQETGRTGFYLRCLRPGWVRAGDALELVRSAEAGMSIAEANRRLYGGGPEELEELYGAMDRAEALAAELRAAAV